MSDREAREAALAAVMRSDLMTSGASTDVEVVDAVIASAQNLLPDLRPEAVMTPDPEQPRSVVVRLRRVDPG